jgi:ATP/maltotriose-dependent transcriptional regulator MalT/DNA-binding SARP family transcriptional activator
MVLPLERQSSRLGYGFASERATDDLDELRVALEGLPPTVGDVLDETNERQPLRVCRDEDPHDERLHEAIVPRNLSVAFQRGAEPAKLLQGLMSGESENPEHRPSAAVDMLRRHRLEYQLDEAFERRLTLVVAGVGYGKSTLLAGWASDMRFAWHSVRAEDRALESLARGVTAALDRRVDGLEVRLAHELRSAGGTTDELLRAEAVAELLCQTLKDTLPHDLVLVLDDVHVLADAPGSGRFLESVLRQAPARLHLVLASRTPLAFPVDRLKAQGEVLELETSSLAFTSGEVETLLGASCGLEAAAHAEPIHAGTAGWPAAVRLALEALRTASADEWEAVIARIRDPGGPLYDYLASVAFAPEDPAIDVLRRVATFDRLSIELCEELGIAGAEEVLMSLAHRGLFVETDGTRGGWITLHSLLRDFVRARWPLEVDELRDLHKHAATWFASRNAFADAASSVAVADDEDAAAELLTTVGARMLAAGAVETVVAVGALLPAGARSGQIDRLLGQAYQIRGDWAQAVACLEQAAGESESLDAGLAWRMGAIRFLQGDPEGALGLYERGRVNGSSAHDEALLLAWSASAQWVQGNADACRSLARRARDLALESSDDDALAAADIALGVLASMEGDRVALDHFREGLDAAERAGDVLQLIRLRVNLQMPLFEDGRYEEALAEVDVAVRQAETAGYEFFRALGLNNQAETSLALGRFEEAIAYGQAAAEIYRRIGSRWLCLPLSQLGKAYLERGDLTLARSMFEESLRLAEEANEVQAIIICTAGLARLLASEQPEKARSLAERARSYGEWWGHAQMLTAVGWVALAQGDTEYAAATAEEAEQAALSRSNRADRAAALELRAFASGEAEERLDAALELWRALGNAPRAARVELALARLSAKPDAEAAAERAERRLRMLGVKAQAAEAAGLLASLPAPRVDSLAIRTFGGFRVVREGVAVAFVEWRSRKARDLLKILVSRRGRPTPRELLMDALWPDEHPDQLGNRLSIALSTVRAVLDPKKHFPSDHFVRADKSAITLAHEHVSVDVERFLDEVTLGLSLAKEQRYADAVERLAIAESLYSGEFLDEDPYEDWAVPLREEARGAYVEAARFLAEATFGGGDTDAGVRYLLRLLERDSYDEDAHLTLVSMLGIARRHGEARRRYRAYVSLMEELQIEPAPFPA